MKSFFLVIFFLVTKVWACEIGLPDRFSLASSPKEELFFAYDVSRTLHEIPYFRLFNCSKLAMTNKFLMIAFGPQNLEFTDRIGIYDFANDYRNSGCFISNSPFKKNLSYEDRNANLQEKWKLIKSCYEIYVEEESNLPLNMPAKQPGCSYQRHGKNKMSFNGGFCFVKPSFGSSYIMKFALRPECKTLAGQRQLDLKISDLETMINFYSSGDASGTSIDLTALSSYPLRVTISPDESVISASDDYGLATPRFPADYSIPDIHAGIPETRQSQIDRIHFRLPLWVENTCKGVCQYAQPVVGNIEYYELKDGKEEFITSWFDGGIVQPFHQGEISGVGFELPTEFLKVGESYRVKMIFNDPKFDFEQFKNRLKSKISRLEQDIGSLGRGNIRIIPETPRINDIERFPNIEPIPGLFFGQDNFTSIERAVQALRNYLSFKLWPPYFNQICHMDSCHGIKDDYLVLTVDFKVDAYIQEEMQHKFSVTRIERKSSVLPSYEKTSPDMPVVKCPY